MWTGPSSELGQKLPTAQEGTCLDRLGESPPLDALDALRDADEVVAVSAGWVSWFQVPFRSGHFIWATRGEHSPSCARVWGELGHSSLGSHFSPVFSRSNPFLITGKRKILRRHAGRRRARNTSYPERPCSSSSVRSRSCTTPSAQGASVPSPPG